MTTENGALIKWLVVVAQWPLKSDPIHFARVILRDDATEEEVILAAAAIDAWARAHAARYPK